MLALLVRSHVSSLHTASSARLDLLQLHSAIIERHRAAVRALQGAMAESWYRSTSLLLIFVVQNGYDLLQLLGMLPYLVFPLGLWSEKTTLLGSVTSEAPESVQNRLLSMRWCREVPTLASWRLDL